MQTILMDVFFGLVLVYLTFIASLNVKNLRSTIFFRFIPLILMLYGLFLFVTYFNPLV